MLEKVYFYEKMVSMIRSIKSLKSIHKDKDIYVLGSGSSMNHLAQDFFDNKITIGVNRVCRFFRCDYTIAKDPTGLEEILSSRGDSKIILSKHRYGNKQESLNTTEISHYVFDHPCNNYGPNQFCPDLSVITKDSDKIVVSYSTITSAIHLVAYMGAKNIIMCGHDCCEINGKSWVDGYYDHLKPVHQTQEGYNNFLSKIKQHTVDVKGKICEEFGCNIYTLSPFLFHEGTTL